MFTKIINSPIKKKAHHSKDQFNPRRDEPVFLSLRE